LDDFRANEGLGEFGMFFNFVACVSVNQKPEVFCVLMIQTAMTVNYRWGQRQLTAAGFSNVS